MITDSVLVGVISVCGFLIAWEYKRKNKKK